MRTPASLLFAMLASLAGVAQPFSAGTTALTLYDAARDRDIPCQVYYPAMAPGAGQPVAEGTFPTLVFGHGFMMATSAYDYLGQHYAAQGYIVVLPSTEGSLLPNHGRFGADLAFLPGAMHALGAGGNSILSGHVAPASALMGHSMGGGAAILGAAGNSGIQAVLVLAPAETNPSAVAAAAQITAPTLIIAANGDCVTPIAQHAQPMYDATGSDCKAFVDILGGGHCYFADPSTTCSLGELTCGPGITISRSEQHQAVLDVADSWLDRFVRGQVPAYAAFGDTLATSARYTSDVQCLTTAMPEDIAAEGFRASWASPAQMIALEGLRPNDRITVLDAAGREVATATATSAQMFLPLRNAATGLIMVRMERNGARHAQRLAALP